MLEMRACARKRCNFRAHACVFCTHACNFCAFFGQIVPKRGIGRMPYIRFKGGRMCIYAILPKAYACAHNTLAQTNPNFDAKMKLCCKGHHFAPSNRASSLCSPRAFFVAQRSGSIPTRVPANITNRMKTDAQTPAPKRAD